MVKKNVHDNVIYVSQGYGTAKQYGTTVHIAETHWITRDPWPDACEGVEIRFKNRHTPDFLPGRLTRMDEGEYLIESATPVQGIAPGQFAVVYDKDAKLCYGSGIITGRNVML